MLEVLINLFGWILLTVSISMLGLPSIFKYIFLSPYKKDPYFGFPLIEGKGYVDSEEDLKALTDDERKECYNKRWEGEKAIRELYVGDDNRRKFGPFLKVILLYYYGLTILCWFGYQNYEDTYGTLPNDFVSLSNFILGEHFIGGPFNVICLMLLLIIIMILYVMYYIVLSHDKFQLINVVGLDWFWFRYYHVTLLSLLFSSIICFT